MKGPGDHGHRLLAGDGVSRQGLAVVSQIHAGGVELQNGILPVVSRDIGEGVRSGNGLKLQKAVHDARERAPGDGLVRAEGPVLIALDDAVLLAPLGDGGLGPVAGCIGKRGGRRQSQRGGQCRGKQSFWQSNMMHGSSFLSSFVVSLLKKTPRPRSGLRCYVT